MTRKKRYFAKIPFTYGGVRLDRGQITELVGARNDEKLVRLNFFGEVPKNAETYKCAICGAEFIGLAERTHHGNTKHKDLTPEEELKNLEREDKLNEQVGIGKT